MEIKPTSVKVIGAGGIGTMLLTPLCKYLGYGTFVKPQITVVDGDVYEARNAERQVFSQTGPKAEVTALRLHQENPTLDVRYKNDYLTPENISDVIKEGDTVFLCVDNHATRKLVSDYASTLQNVAVVNGGNDLTDGNVILYVRKNGEDLTPSLTAYDKAIQSPEDTIPQKPSGGCQAQQPSKPQLVVTNNLIAARMLSVFYAFRQGRAVSEVYEDILTNNARSATRKPRS